MRPTLQSSAVPRRAIVFDVNETLLDLAPLRAEFERAFGDPAAASRWFAQLLQLSLIATVTETYHDFTRLGAEALLLTARRAGVDLDADGRERILGTMRALPPHADAAAALSRLRDAGFELAALSNSARAGLEAQLGNAGLRRFFGTVLSVDEVRKFKPHRDVYLMAAERLGRPPDELRMVAAHHWDVTGAIRAGLRGAFIARPGAVRGGLDEEPDITAPDLVAAADRIIELDLE